MLLSVAGLAMAPFFPEWWDSTLRKLSVRRSLRIIGVLVLSLLTLSLVYVGPWVVMSILHGTLNANLAEPILSRALLLFFGPGIAIQVCWALHVALRQNI